MITCFKKFSSWRLIGLSFFLGTAIPAWAETFKGTASGGIKNPIKAKDFHQLLTSILEIIIQIGTPIIILSIIFVGFKFVKAQGKPKDIEEARAALWWTLIGAAIVIGAKIIVAIVTNTVGQL